MKSQRKTAEKSGCTGRIRTRCASGTALERRLRKIVSAKPHEKSNAFGPMPQVPGSIYITDICTHGCLLHTHVCQVASLSFRRIPNERVKSLTFACEIHAPLANGSNQNVLQVCQVGGVKYLLVSRRRITPQTTLNTTSLRDTGK